MPATNRPKPWERTVAPDRCCALLRWLIAGIFIVSGGLKLAAPQSFAAVIEAFGLLPDGLVMPAAIGLPLLEIVAGIGLALDLAASLETIAALMVLFIAILGYGIWLGLDVDCGCFGPGDPEAEAFHGLRAALYRDLVIMAAVMGLFIRRRRRQIRAKSWETIWNRIRKKGGKR